MRDEKAARIDRVQFASGAEAVAYYYARGFNTESSSDKGRAMLDSKGGQITIRRYGLLDCRVSVDGPILQNNGDLTNAEGGRILDAATFKHLRSWVENEFTHTGQVETKLDAILSFLGKQAKEDREYYLERSWWEILVSAEYCDHVVNAHKA